ncbi:general stress protein [Fictibacillus sp. 23RED33]|uniref:general stress protein n=1 Tax=Fictibacillus sp. 23RED33 TaxID=2745879 RepID=UPI0018CDA6D5|nr:general stress protein [Fictibacillus sp. 23RED33]MBH0174035.1 general stress protein [Fictibacillus sp. 23RED33]
MDTHGKVVGVFRSEDDAIDAIKELREEGYSDNEISVIAKDKKEVKHIHEETGSKAPEGAATGMATGGILGGLGGLLLGAGALAIPGIGPIVAAGPIAAALGGAAVGAGAGGIVGALVGLGIPENEAKEYEQSVEAGDILVLVDTNEVSRHRQVNDTFRTYRSTNAHRYEDSYSNKY